MDDRRHRLGGDHRTRLTGRLVPLSWRPVSPRAVSEVRRGTSDSCPSRPVPPHPARCHCVCDIGVILTLGARAGTAPGRVRGHDLADVEFALTPPAPRGIAAPPSQSGPRHPCPRHGARCAIGDRTDRCAAGPVPDCGATGGSRRVECSPGRGLAGKTGAGPGWRRRAAACIAGRLLAGGRATAHADVRLCVKRAAELAGASTTAAPRSRLLGDDRKTFVAPCRAPSAGLPHLDVGQD
jgi:hypothetical protein